MAKLGRPRIEPSDELIEELAGIKDITHKIHETQTELLNLAQSRRDMVRRAKMRGATHRAIYEYGGAYVRTSKAREQ